MSSTNTDNIFTSPGSPSNIFAIDDEKHEPSVAPSWANDPPPAPSPWPNADGGAYSWIDAVETNPRLSHNPVHFLDSHKIPPLVDDADETMLTSSCGNLLLTTAFVWILAFLVILIILLF